jgi:hypothetical protein
LRNCPSCGAHARTYLHPITVSYVFEDVDGEARGAIKNTQSWREQYSNNAMNIFDAREQLLAVAKTARRSWRYNNLTSRGYVLLDPQGKVLFEYHGDENGNDYQLITLSGTVIAHVQKARAVGNSPTKYYIHALPENLDSFLILVFVVLIDLTNDKLAVFYESGSFGPTAYD